MARKVPGPPGGVLEVYIPEALENRSDPEPIEIDVLWPTEEERRQLVLETAGDGQALLRLSFERHIKGVRKYTASNDQPIVTGQDLIKHGESDIVIEMRRRLMGLTAQQKKTSAAPSVSSAPETPASNGTAVNAEPMGSTWSGDAA